MSSIGQRLKEIRNTLNMNQKEFSDIGGVGQRAQINYEKDDRSPSANYLENISKIPTVDVQYIITGIRSFNTLSNTELELITELRNSNSNTSAMAIASALSIINIGKDQKN